MQFVKNIQKLFFMNEEMLYLRPQKLYGEVAQMVRAQDS